MSLTSQIRYVKALDSTVTTGVGKTGLAFGDITAKYLVMGGTLTTLTTETITTLGTYQAPTSAAHIRIKEVNSADPTKGLYEVHFHNTQLVNTGKKLWLMLSATNAAFQPLEVDLIPYADLNATNADNLASAAANYSATRGLTGTALPAVAAGAAGGVPILGANTGPMSISNGVTFTNSAGDALALTSSGSDGHGLHASGNGTGSGIRGVGGSTSGNGAMLVGGGTGHGLSAGSGSGATGNGILALSNATAGNGLRCVGTTSGAGISSSGGTTGRGIYALGGSSSGSGFRAEGVAGNASAMELVGQGSGSGLVATGGATGNGISAIGGATSGNGIHSIASTSGHGLNCLGVGTTKHGIFATGGSTTSHGISAVGGGVGHGINAVSGSGATGDGIRAAAASTNGNGLNLVGFGTGAGQLTTGGATGSGLKCVGGPTSGDAILTSTTSGHGMNLTCAGTSKHGLLSTGGSGATSDGIKAVAGTGGVPIRGDITGNITGSVSGSVGSLGTGAITTASFAAGAITSTVIATDAIGASQLAAGAVTEIAAGVWDLATSTHTTAGTFGYQLTTVLDGIDSNSPDDPADQSALEAYIDAAVLTIVGGDGDTLATISGQADAIDERTANLPDDPADNSQILLAIAAAQVDLTQVESGVADLQARTPAALVGGRMDANIGAIDESDDAARRAKKMYDASFVELTVAAVSSTTSFTATGADLPIGNDKVNGMYVQFTSGGLKGYGPRPVTDYANPAGTATFDLTGHALPTLPQVGDEAILIGSS